MVSQNDTSEKIFLLARQAKTPIEKKPKAAYCSCRDAFLPGPSSRLRQDLRPRAFVVSHLGSVMPAVCLTRPQYVLRSYCDSGSSRLPGREADMLTSMLGAALPSRCFSSSAHCFGTIAMADKGSGWCVTDSINCVNGDTGTAGGRDQAVLASSCTTCGMCRRCEACSSRRKPGVAPGWWWVSIVDLV